VKALTAILAIVLVLQTAFTLSLWQEQTEKPSGSQPPPQYNAITTEVKRLATDVAALKTRVSTLETGTATPTSTTTPTSSPIPTPYFVVTVERANMRKGPGPSFSVITTVSQGDRFNAQAFNPSRTWILFCCVAGRSGWIYEPLLIVTHAELIPIATDIPPSPTYTPTSTASSPTPTRTNIPTPTPIGCDPHNPYGPDCDCADFSTQQQAQAFFIAAGGPDSDPHRLDGDNDGIACEHRP